VAAKDESGRPTFFATPARFRQWLAKNHESVTELWVGYYRKDSGRPSMTWPESVDEALCFGWIDGIRKKVDDESYKIRFTPRRTKSIWSAVNIARVAALTREGRMRPAGDRCVRAPGREQLGKILLREPRVRQVKRRRRMRIPS